MLCTPVPLIGALGVARSNRHFAGRPMFSVSASAHPAGSLLKACEAQGAYVDCYLLEVERPVSLCDLIIAFYTSPSIRVERTLLRLIVCRPSSDRDVELLAQGLTDSFAIWKVENRITDQILLKELTGRTKSWLMVQPAGSRTNLYFGSAVIPKRNSGSSSNELGPAFHLLLWFHKLYSQILLSAAGRNLENSKP